MGRDELAPDRRREIRLSRDICCRARFSSAKHRIALGSFLSATATFNGVSIPRALHGAAVPGIAGESSQDRTDLRFAFAKRSLTH